MHFAADAYVRESIVDPAKYYVKNVSESLLLLAGMQRAECNKMVSSSTCATHGEPALMPITEATLLVPVNPYGESKFMVERILADFQAAYGFRSVCLRYFNACGADEAAEIGEFWNPETHLIARAMMALQRYVDDFQVFGADFKTPDGTAICDYGHVADLADAHCAALDLLLRDSSGSVFNLGIGIGRQSSRR